MRRMTREAADDELRGVLELTEEAVALEVHGGEVQLILPAGSAPTAAAARLVRGRLNLENERVLTFELRADGGGWLADEPLDRQEARPVARTGGEARAMTAADIMTREVLTTRPEVTTKELAKRLTYHRISGMPVVDEQGMVLGVVSEADLISKRGATVGEIMTAPVISVDEQTPAIDVAAILTTERIKRVPVLRDGRLIGLIGRSNVVSWAAGQAQG